MWNRMPLRDGESLHPRVWPIWLWAERSLSAVKSLERIQGSSNTANRGQSRLIPTILEGLAAITLWFTRPMIFQLWSCQTRLNFLLFVGLSEITNPLKFMRQTFSSIQKKWVFPRHPKAPLHAIIPESVILNNARGPAPLIPKFHQRISFTSFTWTKSKSWIKLLQLVNYIYPLPSQTHSSPSAAVAEASLSDLAV